MNIKKKLEAQAKGEHRAEALQCMRIFHALHDLMSGVWQREWDTLVKICSHKTETAGELTMQCAGGIYEFYFKPSKIGEIFLKGL